MLALVNSIQLPFFSHFLMFWPETTTNSKHSIGVGACFFTAGPRFSFFFHKIVCPCQIHFEHTPLFEMLQTHRLKEFDVRQTCLSPP